MPARVGFRMAYDSRRREIVLVGGEWWGETWLFDGTSWRRGANCPRSLSNPALAYDSRRDRVVLYGETKYWYGSTNDTWEWDGTWTERTTAHRAHFDGNAVLVPPGATVRHQARQVDGPQPGLETFTGRERARGQQFSR